MHISRKLSILVVSGIAAIVGGGITFALTHDYVTVTVYEILLYTLVGAFISK